MNSGGEPGLIADAVGDERAIEPRRDARHHVARLVGVRGKTSAGCSAWISAAIAWV